MFSYLTGVLVPGGREGGRVGVVEGRCWGGTASGGGGVGVVPPLLLLKTP